MCAGNRSNIYGYTCTRIQVLYLIDIYTSKNEFYQHNKEKKLIIFIPNDGEVQKLSDLHLKSHTHNQALQYKKVLTAQGQYLKRHVLPTVGR